MNHHQFPCYLADLFEFLNSCFEKSTMCLARSGTARLFIPSIRILTQRLISRSFLAFLKKTFFFLLSLFAWWCPLPIFPDICSFTFLHVFLCFPDRRVLFILLFCFSFFIINMTHFSIPNSIRISEDIQACFRILILSCSWQKFYKHP